MRTPALLVGVGLVAATLAVVASPAQAARTTLVDPRHDTRYTYESDPTKDLASGDTTVDLVGAVVEHDTDRLSVQAQFHVPSGFRATSWDRLRIELDTDADRVVDHALVWRRASGATLQAVPGETPVACDDITTSSSYSGAFQTAGSLSLDVARSCLGDPGSVAVRILATRDYGELRTQDALPGSVGGTISLSDPVFTPGAGEGPVQVTAEVPYSCTVFSSTVDFPASVRLRATRSQGKVLLQADPGSIVAPIPLDLTDVPVSGTLEAVVNGRPVALKGDTRIASLPKGTPIVLPRLEASFPETADVLDVQLGNLTFTASAMGINVEIGCLVDTPVTAPPIDFWGPTSPTPTDPTTSPTPTDPTPTDPTTSPTPTPTGPTTGPSTDPTPGPGGPSELVATVPFSCTVFGSTVDYTTDVHFTAQRSGERVVLTAAPGLMHATIPVALTDVPVSGEMALEVAGTAVTLKGDHVVPRVGNGVPIAVPSLSGAVETSADVLPIVVTDLDFSASALGTDVAIDCAVASPFPAGTIDLSAPSTPTDGPTPSVPTPSDPTPTVPTPSGPTAPPTTQPPATQPPTGQPPKPPVARSKTKLTVKLTRRTQKVKGKRATVVIKVDAVRGQARGKLVVRVSDRKVATVKVGRDGTYRVKLPRYSRPGKRVVKVAFTPAAGAPSKHAVKRTTLKVTR